MRILSVAFLFTLGLFYCVNAQVDLSTARANPKTFIFDDGKHTVHGEVYRQLKEYSSCCGNDAIYLEVKFDQQGIVTSAKTLTGKNDCYKKSVIDVIRTVRWDAAGVTGTKTIYFEVKPIIPCSGSPGENEYKAIVGTVPVASNNTDKEESSSGNVVEETEEVVEEVVEETEEVIEEAEEVVEEVVEETEEVVEEVVADNNDSEDYTDSFLSDSEVSSSTEPKTDNTAAKTGTGKDAIKNREGVATSGKDEIKNRNNTTVKPVTAAQPAQAYSGPIKIPPQATDIKYESKGERSPTDDHRETFANVQGQTLNTPKYADGEGQFALQIRKALRESGFCGLAQGLMEIEISPAGQVINSRMLAANTDEVREVVPGIVAKLRYSPQGAGKNYRIYQEFKAEIVCKGQKPQYENLENVPNIITTPENSNP